jgi:OFA family oxalate/formate antiporter-like MFS transporter
LSTLQSELGLPSGGGLRNNRWFQLVTALIMMMMIAGTQYAWSLYSSPLKDKLGVSLPIVQYAFTMYVIFETLSQPVGGWFVDKFGTKVTLASGIFVGVGWAMMGHVESPGVLYFFYAMVGTGAGITYGTCISIANRWFPDKRGLASGLIAAGFGAGALPFLPFISSMIKSSGVGSTFTTWGIIQGVIIAVCALLIKFPHAATKGQPKEKKVVKEGDFKPSEMLRTPHFWVLYAMLLSVNFGGLLITANSVPYGKSIGIAAAVITLTVSIQTGANGIARIAWGWISDRLGRYRTMAISFGLNAVILFLLPILGKSPVMFPIMVGLAILTWGQCYSLFPPINTELFGNSFSTVNYGIIYSAKGLAGIFGGGLGAYFATTMGWQGAFTVAAASSLFACLCAIFVLPKMAKPKQSKSIITDLQATEKAGV